ncbi:hypothetical protein P7K49_031266 [Saguinus oedipus]|uniref:AMOP domain-containing protein n=1 Tax=Saguinus oedipus TaxID=9490 RepID=A0ABQ9TZU9_SAGOE|nr:hypothetical protein P7K49_031266 [Saguinus oedipus]
MCLQWLRSQPQRPSWGWNQLSCPCSWQQGRWDLRFRPVSIGDTSFLSPTSPPTILSAHALSLSPETTPCLFPAHPWQPQPGPEHAWTCFRSLGPWQQAALQLHLLARRRVLQLRALGRASRRLARAESSAVRCPPMPAKETAPCPPHKVNERGHAEFQSHALASSTVLPCHALQLGSPGPRPPDSLLFSAAQELEPQSWCCRWNDKPYLCALYQQRRPRVGCAAYRPPRPGEAQIQAQAEHLGRGASGPPERHLDEE